MENDVNEDVRNYYHYIFVSDWNDPQLCQQFVMPMKLQAELKSKVKKEHEIVISSRNGNQGFQDLSEADLIELFQAANVEFQEFAELTNDCDIVLEIPDEEIKVGLRKSRKQLCPRCRLFSSTSEGELCLRCSEVVKNINWKQ